MFKHIAKKPVRRVRTYLKFGFVITEHEYFHCPHCDEVLDAGPCYTPDFCSKCGQRLNFRGIQWKPDRELGYAKKEVTG